MSVFTNFLHVSLFVVLVGLAVISGLVFTTCVEEEDAESAWVWGASFVASSFGVAWSFWGFV